MKLQHLKALTEAVFWKQHGLHAKRLHVGLPSALLSTHWSQLLCTGEPTASAERKLLLHFQVHLPKRSPWLQTRVSTWGFQWEKLGWDHSRVTLGGQQRPWLLWLQRDGCPAPVTLKGCQQPHGSSQRETPRESYGPGNSREKQRPPAHNNATHLCRVRSCLTRSRSHPASQRWGHTNPCPL